MVDLEVKIGGITLKNPVTTASGCFGYGLEYTDFLDISRLGAIFTKATTGEPREGNPSPRMAETPMGMINSVGLQNKGVDHFIEHIYPHLSAYDTHFIVNVSGSTVEEYVEVASKIDVLEKIPGIELNISCPNVKEGGMVFGTDPVSARKVIRAVREAYHKTLIVKLSPNVTSIKDFALIAQEEGADSVSLINTLLAMAIDAERRKPLIARITGGLSGPAVKPIALRMVWEVAQAVEIPVIGLGGISSATDVIEFMLAGATAVQVGTANFIDPAISLKILEGIIDYMERHGFSSVKELTGALEI